MNKENNNNVLLTKEDLLKEEFNITNIEEAKNITEFLLYFTRILRLGVNANLIAEDQFNVICNMITRAVQDAIIINEDDEFADSSIQMANFMYVITLYLLTKTNWEAWLELKDITSKEEAKEFIFNVKKWMENQITRQLVLLETVKERVKQLKINHVTNCYLALRKVLLDFSSFDNANSIFSLKKYHVSAFLPGTYIFLVNDFDYLSNFFDKICRMIHNFRIEVSIMAAINAGNVVNAKKEESSLESMTLLSQRDALDKKYQDMLRELYDKHNRDLNQYFEKLNNPKSKKGKLLDEVELEKDYDSKKLAIEDEWEKKVKELEKLQKQRTDVMFEILDKDYSLEDIIKEYAIFSLAKKGKINYPSTVEERAKMLISIKLNVAIKEFIENIKLNDEQITYLKSAML